MSSDPQQADQAGVGGGYVTPEMCDDWRKRHESVEGRGQREVAEAVGVPESTVKYHLNGQCKHAPAQRGVHDVRDNAERRAVLDVLEDMLDHNYGDTIHTSSRRVRGFATAELHGQKVRAVLADLADGDQTPRGLAAERFNPGADPARYAVTRVGEGVDG